MSRFDVVVVGGGTAGLTAALAARHEGATVALVERAPRLGGECTFNGCVPSKTLIDVARLAFELQTATADGLIPTAPTLDFAAVSRRLARTVAQIAADERDERFTAVGVEIFHGTAAFAGAHELRVDGQLLEAARFVVATGSDPAVPALEGLGEVEFLTNETIFALDALPGRLLVLGGGPVGLELGQAFHRLGSRVTIVELAERLLPTDEPEAGALLARVLRDEGIDLRLGAHALHVSSTNDEIALDLADGTACGDALLVASGRSGRTAGLGLEQLGIECESGYVAIDARCRTSARHVYAAGDVTGGLQFTHVAAHQGQVAGRNAAGKRARRDERVTPWVTFTDPEIAHVGLTEEQARRQHRHVVAETFPMKQVDRARILERPLGFVKLVTAGRPLLGRTGGGKLVGAQIVGPRAGELIHECALAIKTNAFAGRLAQTIHAYPAMSLAVQQAGSQFFPRARALTPREP